MRIVSLLLLTLFVWDTKAYYYLSDDFIGHINRANSTWTAGPNFHPGTSVNYIRGLMGVHPMSEKFLPPKKEIVLGNGDNSGWKLTHLYAVDLKNNVVK